jgi:uncharacterized membrane protein
MQMGFGQKLNQWLHSGGEITRIWKWCFVIFVVGILLAAIIPPLGSFVMALAFVGSILATLGAANKVTRRREEIERLQVQEEFEAKKREGR